MKIKAQNLQNIAKLTLRGNFIAMRTYIKKNQKALIQPHYATQCPIKKENKPNLTELVVKKNDRDQDRKGRRLSLLICR